MAQNVIMPKSGMAMEEGTIVRWLKAAGDRVSQGEPIAVIETDKVTMDLESDFEGTLLSVLYPDGSVVKATETIAWIGAPGEKVPLAMTPAAAPSPVAASAQAVPRAPSTVPAVEPVRVKAASRTVPATPAARARAAQTGLDLSTVFGTGPGGAVRLRDLAAAAAAPGAAVSSRAAATLMIRADVTVMASLRERLEAAGGKPLPWAAYAAKAAAAALKETPLGSAAETPTVTDVGSFGILACVPPLDGPGKAVLGLGAVEEQLRKTAAGVESRQVLTLCLTHDPVAIPVADAAAFLANLRALLEEPVLLLAGV